MQVLYCLPPGIFGHMVLYSQTQMVIHHPKIITATLDEWDMKNNVSYLHHLYCVLPITHEYIQMDKLKSLKHFPLKQI